MPLRTLLAVLLLSVPAGASGDEAHSTLPREDDRIHASSRDLACLPSPLRGRWPERSGGPDGGRRIPADLDASGKPPTPDPSPQGGGEAHCLFRWRCIQAAGLQAKVGGATLHENRVTIFPQGGGIALATAKAGRGGGARCEGEAEEDRLRRVEAQGDLATEGGRLLRLADIRLAEAATARLAALVGERLAIGLAGGGDRWGRLPARVVLSRDGTDLATLLVREGLAVVDLGEGDALCRPNLFAEEEGARRAGLGMWASMPVQALDLESLAGRAGTFVVVEGRIVSVGERARRTYLNFGRDFSRDFSVSIARRDWEAMRLAGLSAEALRGRTVRVRGIVEMRRAPSMEVTGDQAIELLPGRIGGR